MLAIVAVYTRGDDMSEWTDVAPNTDGLVAGAPHIVLRRCRQAQRAMRIAGAGGPAICPRLVPAGPVSSPFMTAIRGDGNFRAGYTIDFQSPALPDADASGGHWNVLVMRKDVLRRPPYGALRGLLTFVESTPGDTFLVRTSSSIQYGYFQAHTLALCRRSGWVVVISLHGIKQAGRAAAMMAALRLPGCERAVRARDS